MREDKIISAMIGLVGACNNNLIYDMGEAALLGLLNETENIEHNMKSGGMQNDQENYKN